MFRKYLLALAVLATATAADANVIANNFDAENGGVPTLNYAGFADYTVTGSVDLIGNGFFDWAYAGNGLYVDLAGSTGQFGALTTKTVYGPGTYLVTINLGGTIYDGIADGAVLSWGSGSRAWDFAGPGSLSDSFLVSLGTASAFTIADAGRSGNPNIGATLFELDIAPVANATPLADPPIPEPLTLALMGAGLIGAFRLRRSRKS